ncbi:hypothetical protein ABPG74_002357 [Tetrahymena malaccensis]
MEEKDQRQRNIEHFKIKKLMTRLRNTRGSGTSMVSLIIPPKKQINDSTKLINDEYSKATNIKDRVNRQSVQDAMVSALQRLKLYPRTPNNGLILYCGKVLNEEGKEIKLLIDFEPYKPINTSLYFCDSKFHVDELGSLLETDPPFGFIIMDGQGALYANLQGNTKTVLNKFSVELPKKHGRGGQSSVRFARLRVEKRHNYLRKVCEVATQTFISQDKINVQGLVLAGSGDFKNELSTTQMFDPRLACKIIKIVDVSYGGENGLNQAIELAQESLTNVKFVQEKNVISKFFDCIAIDSGTVVYGVQDTMQLLLDGVIENILCFEELTTLRVTRKNKVTEQITHIFIPPNELNNPKHFKDGEHELEKIEVENLTEWLAEHYSEFGAELYFITDKSAEGCQFVKGFSGIGGFLRYKVDLEHIVNPNDEYNYEEEEGFI